MGHPQIASQDLPFNLAGQIPQMNALEILRETVRILRASPSSFMTILALLICPVSAALLSNELIDRSTVAALSRRLTLLSTVSGLPLTHFLKQMCHHLAGTLLSSAFCFPLLLTLQLTARASIAYSVACTYASKKIIAPEFFALARRIWRRLVVTYLWVCGAICGCFGLFLVILIAVCNSLAILGYPPDIIVYPALLVMLGFSMVYAHTIIVCNLAGVISVLEDVSGPRAILRSVSLVKGQTQAGLLIFLGSTIGMAFVEGLFEHRVKTLSYGDGSSRIWEGPLLVVMYSFVVLVDSMMSAVFYFTCRSSCMEMLNGSEHSLAEIENFSSFQSRSIEALHNYENMLYTTKIIFFVWCLVLLTRPSLLDKYSRYPLNFIGHATERVLSEVLASNMTSCHQFSRDTGCFSFGIVQLVCKLSKLRVSASKYCEPSSALRLLEAEGK